MRKQIESLFKGNAGNAALALLVLASGTAFDANDISHLVSVGYRIEDGSDRCAILGETRIARLRMQDETVYVKVVPTETDVHVTYGYDIANVAFTRAVEDMLADIRAGRKLVRGGDFDVVGRIHHIVQTKSSEAVQHAIDNDEFATYGNGLGDLIADLLHSISQYEERTGDADNAQALRDAVESARDELSGDADNFDVELEYAALVPRDDAFVAVARVTRNGEYVATVSMTIRDVHDANQTVDEFDEIRCDHFDLQNWIDDIENDAVMIFRA